MMDWSAIGAIGAVGAVVVALMTLFHSKRTTQSAELQSALADVKTVGKQGREELRGDIATLGGQVQALDDCLHRVEMSVTKALLAFQAQVPSRSEVDSRISHEIKVAVTPIEKDIDRISRALEQHR
jgi:hypothetical protein